MIKTGGDSIGGSRTDNLVNNSCFVRYEHCSYADNCIDVITGNVPGGNNIAFGVCKWVFQHGHYFLLRAWRGGQCDVRDRQYYAARKSNPVSSETERALDVGGTYNRCLGVFHVPEQHQRGNHFHEHFCCNGCKLWRTHN